jgi:hypothetical protein
MTPTPSLTLSWRAAECRHATGREKMGSPTLQTHQDPILMPWLGSRWRTNLGPNTQGLLLLSTLSHTPRSEKLPVQATKHVLRWGERGTHQEKPYLNLNRGHAGVPSCLRWHGQCGASVSRAQVHVTLGFATSQVDTTSCPQESSNLNDTTLSW